MFSNRTVRGELGAICIEAICRTIQYDFVIPTSKKRSCKVLGMVTLVGYHGLTEETTGHRLTNDELGNLIFMLILVQFYQALHSSDCRRGLSTL